MHRERIQVDVADEVGVTRRSDHDEGADEPGMFGDHVPDHRQNYLVIEL
jgi:hypothetical protein